MTLINVNKLKPGMVLGKDIENVNTGMLFIPSGTVLNTRLIFHIKNLGIKLVNILDKKNVSRTVNENAFLNKHEKLSSKMTKVFCDVKFGKKIIISEITKELDNLIQEIFKNNNILSRLRQIEQKDDYTFNHSMNVCMLASMTGKWLKYSQIKIKQLSLAALFHDIGKLKISNDVIKKSTKLTESEFNIVKKHPIYGSNILSDTVGISKNVILGILQHHEREDGSGYPYGLKGDKIHEFAKIIAVCDIYDAMTTDRIYETKKSPFLVAEYLNSRSFSSLDPKVTRVFLDNISKFYVGNEVKLSNNEIGQIIYIYPQMPTRPIVKVGEKFINLLQDKDIDIVDIIK